MLRWTAEADADLSPPALGQRLHRHLRSVTGVRDPYRREKDRQNQLILEMLPALRRRLAGATDPFGSALQLAVSGNVIDLGIEGQVSDGQIHAAVEQALTEPLHGHVDELRREIAAARDILYLADNCGEIVFDRLLIEQMPSEKVTLAVRGEPILNDATLADARTVGLTEFVEVIDNGSDAPGTLLGSCSAAFRRRFEAADLIIAKGQGNFESLSEVPAPIWFLFRVKCAVVAEHVQEAEGTHLVLRQQAPSSPR